MQNSKLPFFMHPPFGKWDDKIVEMIEHHAFLGYRRQQIVQKALAFPPLHGWDGETLSFVSKAIETCFGERCHA